MSRPVRSRRRLYLFAALTLLTMLFIFLMSAKDGDSSGALSESFLGTALAQLIEWFHPERFGWSVELVIRKLAHMFEFFCLGLTSFLFFSELWLNCARRYPASGAAALLWSFLYACSDEWHQTFVAGRAGLLSDVLIDTCGALIAVAVALLSTAVRSRSAQRKA